MLNSQELLSHLRFVYTNSLYYRALWRQAWPNPQDEIDLAQLPVVDSKSFWQANQFEDNQVVTGVLEDAIVFKSGGTTGNPKYSYFSHADWKQFCRVFGEGLIKAGMKPDERVANLFYGGQLYASFLFVSGSMAEAGVGVNFPVSGMASQEEILKTLTFFKVETVALVPTTLMMLLPALAQLPTDQVFLKRVIYGGEPMQPDQIAAVKAVLPGCEVQSIGVAGVDYGELGFVDETCEVGVHRLFDATTRVELLDEDFNPIEQLGVPGDLYVTNIGRRLMPIVRYPVGDRGEWLDPAGTEARRFRLLGRSEEGARIGPVSVYIEDIQKVLESLDLPQTVIGFQLVAEHFDQKDRGVLRLAVANPQSVPETASQAVRMSLYKQRSLYPDLVEQNSLHPFLVEWVFLADLVTNSRTGKLLRVVDRRSNGS